jgi:hypothetical protein
MLGIWVDGEYYVEGLKYEFPKRPPLKDIRGYGIPKSKQKWSRVVDYEKFDWSGGWEDRLNDNPDQVNYLVEEVERLNSGMWLYVNGEPTYINSYFYFFLNWFLLPEGVYPEYRDTSLYYYRFLEICDNTKTCLGHTLLKARRLGATSMIMSALLLKMLTLRNANLGIVSKKGKDAGKAFQYAVKALGNLPEFLKPIQEGNTAPKQVLSLKKQADRITKTKKSATKGEGLNNELSWENTDLNSYDGYALAYLLIDEGGKFPTETPINKYLSIAAKCVKKGARITGKIFMPTTVNDKKSGGAEYQITWQSSDQSKANYLGETKTGLYRIMLPAYFGYDGWIGAFGESVWDTPTPEQTKYLETIGCLDPTIGAKQYQANTRKALENDLEALEEEIRQNPWNDKEVFESANKKIHFDRKRHEAQLQVIKDQLVAEGKDPEKDELGRRGWFREKFDGTVFFEDDPKGLWYILQFPDKPNQFEKSEIGGKPKYKPTGTAYGGAGLDAIAHSDATVEKGSDASIMIRRRYTIIDPEKSGCPVAMFLGRMDNKPDFHKQTYWGLKFYGVRMLGERSPTDWVDWAKENGYEQFLLGTQRSDGTWVYGAAPQNKEYIEEHLTEMVESSYNDVEKIFFKRLIKDRLDFDVNDRTDYDTAISDGNSLITIKEPLKQVKDKPKGKKFVKHGRITTYR